MLVIAWTQRTSHQSYIIVSPIKQLITSIITVSIAILPVKHQSISTQINRVTGFSQKLSFLLFWYFWAVFSRIALDENVLWRLHWRLDCGWVMQKHKTEAHSKVDESRMALDETEKSYFLLVCYSHIRTRLKDSSYLGINQPMWILEKQ
jgi:hypothetical protein